MAEGRSWVDGPRLVLEASCACEDGAVFVIGRDPSSGEGDAKRLFVSVAEEKAVDSYNQTFECTLSATIEQARQLRDWLMKNVKDVD